MQYKPHDYQQYAINYILEHPIAAVILGMGLGKTSITLTAIEQLMYDSFEINKVLVVFLLILIWCFWMSFHPLRTGTANALRLL